MYKPYRILFKSWQPIQK